MREITIALVGSKGLMGEKPETQNVCINITTAPESRQALFLFNQCDTDTPKLFGMLVDPYGQPYLYPCPTAGEVLL